MTDFPGYMLKGQHYRSYTNTTDDFFQYSMSRIKEAVYDYSLRDNNREDFVIILSSEGQGSGGTTGQYVNDGAQAYVEKEYIIWYLNDDRDPRKGTPTQALVNPLDSKTKEEFLFYLSFAPSAIYRMDLSGGGVHPAISIGATAKVKTEPKTGRLILYDIDNFLERKFDEFLKGFGIDTDLKTLYEDKVFPSLIPNNPASNSVQGSSFVVNGVKYDSVPADDAAAKALALRQSANAAGQEAYFDGSKGKWDGSTKGREWVKVNIYIPRLQATGKTQSYIDQMATYYANNLATDDESYWSSWFFRRCYESYWDVDKAKRTPGLDPSTVFDYTADQGLALRQKVEANPEQYKDQIVFLTFRTTEAPIFIGDSVWNSRVKGNNSFDVLTPSGTQKPSHMKVITTTEGTNYRAIGGNEGSYSTVNNVVVKVDDKKMLPSNSYYKAVYKRVKVIGKAEK